MKLSVSALKDSNHFLNIIFENITSAIFLVDEKLKIQQFNQTFTTLFYKKEDQILGEFCGNVIGCKYTIHEQKKCGQTSNCSHCILRKSILKAFSKQDSTYKNTLKRTFYINNQAYDKYFQFTTKFLNFNGQNMVLVILDDITEIEKTKIELEQRNTLIEKYNKKMKNKLILARYIQQNLIPHNLPSIDGISLSAIYKPLEELGGDLYDFMKVDNQSLGIFLSDISGHGVPAAMVTAMVKAIMETSTHLFKHPAALMSYLNRKLVNLSENMFLTAFYGLYDCKNKKLTYMRCGHPYPILIRDGKCLEINQGGSTILGVFDRINFESHTISLKPNDIVLFYTDGLTEDFDHYAVPPMEILYKIIKKHQHKSVDTLINSIYEDVLTLKKNGVFHDDVCVLGLKIHD